jgi:hypothetical protein
MSKPSNNIASVAILLSLFVIVTIQVVIASPKPIIKLDIVTPIGGISLMTSEWDIEASNVVVNRKR